MFLSHIFGFMNKMFIGFIRFSDSVIDFLPNQQLCLRVNTQILKSHVADFPSSTVDGNLPAKAGAWSLVWEDVTCHRTTKPEHSNYCAHALDHTSHNYWVCAPQRLETTCLGTQELQLLKPARSRACKPRLLSPCAATIETHMLRACDLQSEKPSHHTKEEPPLPAARESPLTATKTKCNQNKTNK